jgi:hypothetical protein
MLRFLLLLAMFGLLAACNRQTTTAAKGRLADMVQSNTKLVGYLYSADQPYVVVAFQQGVLRWRSDPQSNSASEGRPKVFNWPDKTCLGFEEKNLSMPSHSAERYLVCEATAGIQHRNHLPRSQDFFFKRGDVFLEYQPPEGTGFPQVYYAGAQK